MGSICRSPAPRTCRSSRPMRPSATTRPILAATASASSALPARSGPAGHVRGERVAREDQRSRPAHLRHARSGDAAGERRHDRAHAPAQPAPPRALERPLAGRPRRTRLPRRSQARLHRARRAPTASTRAVSARSRGRASPPSGDVGAASAAPRVCGDLCTPVSFRHDGHPRVRQHREELRRHGGAARRVLRRPRGRDLRAARAERRRQEHAHPDPHGHHPRRLRRGAGLRRAAAARASRSPRLPAGRARPLHQAERHRRDDLLRRAQGPEPRRGAPRDRASGSSASSCRTSRPGRSTA